MNDVWIRAVILVCVFGAVLLGAETLLGWLARRRVDSKAVNQRMKLIASGRTHGEALTLLRQSLTQFADQFPAPLGGLGKRFDRLMTAAQLGIPAGRVLLFLIVAPLTLLLVAIALMLAADMPIGFGRLLMIGTFAVVVGEMLPLAVLQFKATRARTRMQAQFPVALDIFVRGLRAGHPIAAALELLTTELPDPIGTEFGIVVDEVTYGADLRDALQAMADRWDLEDMRMFVVSLSVQSETGGNLAEILENLSRVIRERSSMAMKVRALSSEGRITAVMLTALPILAFSALFLLNPPFYLDVADDPAFIPGFASLAFLYVVGFITIRRMVDLKV